MAGNDGIDLIAEFIRGKQIRRWAGGIFCTTSCAAVTLVQQLCSARKAEARVDVQPGSNTPRQPIRFAQAPVALKAQRVPVRVLVDPDTTQPGNQPTVGHGGSCPRSAYDQQVLARSDPLRCQFPDNAFRVCRHGNDWLPGRQQKSHEQHVPRIQMPLVRDGVVEDDVAGLFHR